MKKKKWPFIYVAVITILTYIPILLTVVYSFNASKLTSVWEGFFLEVVPGIIPGQRSGRSTD